MRSRVVAAVIVSVGCGSGEPEAYEGGAGGSNGVAGEGPVAVVPPFRSLTPQSIPPEVAVARPPVGESPVERVTDGDRCPEGMVWIDPFCIDRFEAPNRPGALPLVMYTLVEAAEWCAERGKRLCYDDEWTRACGGEAELRYPYGDEHEPARCNDARVWRAFDQARLDGWPRSVATPSVESLDQLLASAARVSAAGEAAQTHVWWLYQADPSGSRDGCVGPAGAFDLCGNVEEWTRRRAPGGPGFSGSLKGRYWAEARTCASSVLTHGDHFRFYEIGFRCCVDG